MTPTPTPTPTPTTTPSTTPTPKQLANQITKVLRSDAASFQRHWISFNSNDKLAEKQLQRAFRSQLFKTLRPLIEKLHKCEQQDYKEAALDVLDLGAIYSGVDRRIAEQEQAKLKLKGKKDDDDDDDDDEKKVNKEEEFGYQEFIVLELLKWYKHSFFKWFTKPDLPGKTGEAKFIGTGPPNKEEQAGDARLVEMYLYDDGTVFRFPRYNDTKRLLQWRQGRCGEWNICFYQILRALDIRTRYVWNAEDHVWLEMYSKTWGRWVHIDSCEESFDNPSLYNKGWGKKMSYCIAVSLDGAKDVTRRYVVDEDKQLPRKMLDENSLQTALLWQTAILRQPLYIDDKWRLRVEDYFEELELKGELNGETGQTESERGREGQPALPRQSGAGEWTKDRGEDGK